MREALQGRENQWLLPSAQELFRHLISSPGVGSGMSLSRMAVQQRLSAERTDCVGFLLRGCGEEVPWRWEH